MAIIYCERTKKFGCNTTIVYLKSISNEHLRPITNEDRQPVPETNVIYFVSNTEKNIQIIGNDMKNNLYDLYNICFINYGTMINFELLASYTLENNSAFKISMVTN